MSVAYLAGPMSGIEHFNYPAFEEAAAYLREMGYEVLSPHEIDQQYPYRAINNDPKLEWLWYMGKCIPMVFKADFLALLPGWEDSQGACIERCIAEERGIRVLMYEYLRSVVPVK